MELTPYQLNDEQKAALEYVAQGSDLSVLVGRPGVGKSYLLKPVKEHFEAHGCRVLGASLSGKVAKALQADTGIQSYTLASLNYRLQREMICLTSSDVVVIDEAGMVDFASLSAVIDAVNKAQAKLILVGDPDQLKPIHKGEIFRGIASIAGFMELSQIRRQHDPMDREASLKLSKGQMDEALAHYDSKGAIVFSDTLHDSVALLVHEWQGDVNALSDIKEQVMFAFSRAAVASINLQARDALKSKAMLQGEEYLFERSIPEPYMGFVRHEKVMIQSDMSQLDVKRGETGRIIACNEDVLILGLQGKEVHVPRQYWGEILKIENNTIALSQGERILFRKNDAQIGVRNGDMAFIESIHAQGFMARLDSGEVINVPKSYKHLDYGYATTVHKGQGMTVDGARVLIDSHYWDRFLSFVAMTRHRKTLRIYADRHQHQDLKALHKTLSRSSTKDNVIDWPLDLAIRHGFDSDSLIGRVINHLAGVGHKIKEKYNYLVNYEAYARQKMLAAQRDSKQRIRAVAKHLADYQDAQSQYSKLRKRVMKKADALKRSPDKLEEFNVLYEQSIKRDKKAYELWTKHHEDLCDVKQISFDKDALQKASERHERYLVIKEIIERSSSDPITDDLMKRAGRIDLEKDAVHVIQLAKQYQKPVKELIENVELVQKAHRQQLFKSLASEYPVLVEYDKLYKERSQSTGFRAEQLDKLLLGKAREISKDNKLVAQLKRDLPKFAQSLALRVKNHDLGLDKER
ncbi:TPA: AAA family ATPase [Legionella pneumophila]